MRRTNQLRAWSTLLVENHSGKATTNKKLSLVSVCHVMNSNALNKNIIKFWKMENVSKRNSSSLVEKACEEHFSKTMKFDLKFKDSPNKFR